MMYCNECGKENSNISTYCKYCGKLLQSDNSGNDISLYYHLPFNEKRSYDIKVYKNEIVFEGKFWYLKDKEFYRNKQPVDTVLIKNFLGIGYLKKRSYKKCVAFVLGGLILSVIKTVIDKLSELADKANSFLQWVGKSVTLPEWMDITLNVVTVICLLLAVLFFLSKKSVVEISFTDKRICIPQKSLSKTEFVELYQVLSKD